MPTFLTGFLSRVLARQFPDVSKEQNSSDSLELVPLITTRVRHLFRNTAKLLPIKYTYIGENSIL